VGGGVDARGRRSGGAARGDLHDGGETRGGLRLKGGEVTGWVGEVGRSGFAEAVGGNKGHGSGDGGDVPGGTGLGEQGGAGGGVGTCAGDRALDDDGGAEVAEGQGRIIDVAAADDARRDNPERALRDFEIGELVGERIHEAGGDGLVSGIVGGVGKGEDGDVL